MTAQGTTGLEEAIIASLSTRYIMSGGFEVLTDRPDLKELGEGFEPDLIVRAGDLTLIIELKHTLSLNDVARGFMYQHLIAVGNLLPRRSRYVLMAKVVPDRARSMAQKTDVDIIRLPPDVELPGRSRERRFKVNRLSHEKSWRVVTGLLRMGPTSIRQVSLETRVSYGWAHATTERLLQMGVATRSPDGISITDVEKLLNGVAWERPMKELSAIIIYLSGEDVMGAARTVERSLGEWSVRHAFGGITAGGLYTGYAQRFDRLYVYVEKDQIDMVTNAMGDPNGSIALEILRPDREVFDPVEKRQGLTLVGPSQALLDLAGMGYSALDLTLEMVRTYAETKDR
jgi:hypothetical protein